MKGLLLQCSESCQTTEGLASRSREGVSGVAEQAKLVIQERETGRLHRRQSIVMKKALPYQKLRFLELKAIAERCGNRSRTHTWTPADTSSLSPHASPTRDNFWVALSNEEATE